MNLIQIFSQNPYFKTKSYLAGSLIFDEGKKDEHLYIIVSGKIAIEKYTSEEQKDLKELALLGPGDTFGEGSLSNDNPKESRARALEDSELLFIHARNDITNCMRDFPKESLLLLNEIISLTNKRLLLANREITVNSELQKTISLLEKIDMKHIFFLIDRLKLIFACDYILYIEKSQFISDAIVIRYDTRAQGKFQDIAIRFPDDFSQDVLEKNGINLGGYTLIQKLSLGKENMGYLIFGDMEKIFFDSDRRITQSISNSIAGILHQMKTLKEERDKEYMKTL